MTQTFDSIVIGCGGFGSAALYHAAKRGAKVLGIERHTLAHDLGSSHGESRIIRKAYFEHPDYVPLLHEAFTMWRDLEAATETTLLHECGLFIAGPADGQPVAGAKLAATQHSLPFEVKSATDLDLSFRGFRIPETHEVVIEPDAGFLMVEDCVVAHLHQAMKYGATVKQNETVIDWKSNGQTVTVQTDRATYSAANLIVTAGAWTQPMLHQLNIPLHVIRKFMFWHDTHNPAFSLDNNARVFFFDLPEGEFYGVPSFDGPTIKVGRHTGGMTVTEPSTFERHYQPPDHAPVEEFVRQHLVGVDSKPRKHSACMYTCTPDGHFVVDHHPELSNVVIGAGFSGHGFKFTGILGRCLAELALDKTTDSPIQFLGCQRLLTN